MPANPGPRVERKIFPMFSRCKIARTPGIFSAASVSSLTTRPLAIVASTGTAYSIPGKGKSEVYCALPVTFCGPSTRGVLRPMGDVVDISCAVGMFCPQVTSGCRHLQGVGEAALGQFDLELVLALRPGVAKGRLGGFSESRLVGRLPHQRCFGLGGAPGFGAHATERDACPRHIAPGDRHHQRCRGERELV